MIDKRPFKSDNSIFTLSDHINDFDNVESTIVLEKFCDNRNPIISIVIPTYESPTILNAINSALNQNFEKKYEILVIDNCSKDISPIVDLFSNLNDLSCDIRLFRNQENIGLFGNWNRCIKLARAPYITYLHSDDSLLPSTLHTLWDIHNKTNTDYAIIGRYQEVDSEGNTIKSYIKRTGFIHSKAFYRVGRFGVLHGDLCNGCGSLLCKRVIEELGGWNPDFYPGSDRVLFYNYFDKYGVIRVNEVVRKETTCYSMSSTIYKQYPLVNYYMQKDVIDRYFIIKPIWRLCIYSEYLVYCSHRMVWDNDEDAKKLPIAPWWAKGINWLFQFSYRFVDKSLH